MLPPGLPERVSVLVGHSVTRAESAVGGFSNLVFLVDNLVVKAARTVIKRADLKREAAMLLAISDLELGSAGLFGASYDEQWALVATKKVGGLSPAHDWAKFVFALAHDADHSFRVGRAIGHRLRNIHAAAPFPVVDVGATRPELLFDALSSIQGSEQTIPVDISTLMVRALNDSSHNRGATFIHGDFGLHNLLLHQTDPGLPVVSAVLDWELAGWGNPVTDLAWLAWTLWFRDLPAGVWRGVVSAYGDWAIRALGWNHDDVMAAVISQMALLMSRTDPESAVRQVWVERVRSLTNFVAPTIEA